MLERWVINTCDVVITIGADLEHHVKRINPEAKTVLIQNLAVHAEEAGSSHSLARELKMGLDNRLTVVYTGSFEPYQGLDLLLRSAKIVREQHSDVLFIMVGGNPQQVDHWQSQASICGLGDSMLFTGTVPPAEAIAYLDVATILVSPRTEGMSVPLKIYSYLQAGKPIVATDVPAHSHVLDAEVALLVAPTEEAFADGILTLAQSPSLRKKLGLRAQQFARERFDPADYLAKLQLVYQQLGASTPPSEQAAGSRQSDQTHSPQGKWLRLP
jgi:glycosyltransferase involved in cell wall biosynthesis